MTITYQVVGDAPTGLIVGLPDISYLPEGRTTLEFAA